MTSSRSQSHRLRIPWELILNICRESTIESLVPLCGVSFATLQLAGPLLYRDLEIETTRRFLALFFEPSTLPQTSRLRPLLGLHLVTSLSLSLPKSNFYTGSLSTPDLLSPPLRLLQSSSPPRSINLRTLDLTIPNLQALKLYFSLLLPHLNPLNLLLHPPLNDQLYFIPFQVERHLLHQAFGNWNRLQWISFCSLAVLGLESKTLFCSEPSLFNKMPRISFDFRNAKPGSSVATSYSLPGPGAASWALFGSRIWLSVLIGGCGVCTLLQAFVPGWRTLVGLRTILGLFEGGVFPGFLYSLTFFYAPKNLTVRISSFTLAASIAFALGSFLAGALLPIKGGERGLEGWQLLFLYQGLATLLIAFLLFNVLPSSPEETSSFLPPHLHSLLLLSQPPPPSSPPLLPTPPPGLSEQHAPFATSASSSSSRAASPKANHNQTHGLSPARLPLLTSLLNRSSLPTPLETLLSPLTISLSLGYLLLLLATTPSAFLPRILQSRYALSERTSNLLVGFIYAIGGVLQLGIGALAGRKGVLRIWRVVAVAVVGGWMSVGVWEGLGMQGRGPEGEGGVLRWDENVRGRWVGIGLRVLVTMTTPTLGSLYLSQTVSIPSSLAPQMGTLTAAVVAVGNIGGALGPSLYSSAIPALDEIPSIPPIVSTTAARLLVITRSGGYPLWQELSSRDFAMALSVLGSWIVFEGVARWVDAKQREGGVVTRGRGRRRSSGPSLPRSTTRREEEEGGLLEGEREVEEG